MSHPNGGLHFNCRLRSVVLSFLIATSLTFSCTTPHSAQWQSPFYAPIFWMKPYDAQAHATPFTKDQDSSSATLSQIAHAWIVSDLLALWGAIPNHHVHYRVSTVLWASPILLSPILLSSDELPRSFFPFFSFTTRNTLVHTSAPR
jgi:hypothetical protein